MNSNQTSTMTTSNDHAEFTSVNSSKVRALFISIAPPENHCGVRVVMHRHLVEREPFEVLVATNTSYAVEPREHVRLQLSPLMQRLRRTRLHQWVLDYENLIWPLLPNSTLDDAVQDFRPNVILTLADTCLSELALRTAQRYGLPLAGLFLDWFPIMNNHYGHSFTQDLLSRRFRKFYNACDLAFCTSDGMQEVLGPHPNSHVIYPMPGKHQIPQQTWPSSTGKFRIVYVGSVENFYGRMLCSLIEKISATTDLEIIVVGPNADWPADILESAKANGTYLGFKPPEEAAQVLASADALLVVMSFEEKYQLFMQTSFTTKFLDYVAFAKPVILWGPEYCTPVRVVEKHGGAILVTQPEADAVVNACHQLNQHAAVRDDIARQAQHLHQTLFNPNRLQSIFVTEMEKITQL
jgi:hypothetical protein